MSATGPRDPATTLVGRERELVTLREALDAALAGRGSLVLIGGEAGIGKTALAEALLAEAQAQGALVLVGRCYDLSETPPYGPWRELFAHAPRDTALPTLPLAVLPPEREGVVLDSQDAIFGRVQAYLAALVRDQPLVLFLDDLHWADPASLDLLRIVARQLAAWPLLLLGTCRAEEVARAHPLYPLLPLLVREARAIRLDVSSLAASDLDALVRARFQLPEADGARLVAYLDARSQGNPFYAGELLRAIEEDRQLRRVDAGWVVGDLTVLPVPALLRQVIDTRLARLGEEVVGLLGVAAVIGQVVPHDLWAAVSGAEEPALLEAIEGAIGVHLLAEASAEGGYRFLHALIREALYEGILLPRRRAWHRRIGEALAASPTPDPDTIAYHFQRAGDARAVEWLLVAGERARRAYAWLMAAERYEAALTLPAPPGTGPAERALLLLTLAQLRRYSAPARGIPLAEEAERLAEAAGDPTLAAAARFDQGHLRALTLQHRRGLAEMLAAWPALERLSPGGRSRLPALIVQRAAPDEDYHRGALIIVLTWVGRFTEAADLGAPFASRAPGTTPRGLQGLGQALAMLGLPAACWPAYRDAKSAYLAAGQHREVGNTLLQEVDWAAHYRADEPGELLRLAEAYERTWHLMSGVAVTVGSPRQAHLPYFWLAGRWDEACAVERGPAWFHARPWLGQVLRAQGDTAAAGEVVREGLPSGFATDPGDGPIFIQALATMRLAALLALDAGQLHEARDWLTAHDRWLAESGAVLGHADAQCGWAAYHRAAGDRAAALGHAEAALAHATEPRQPPALIAAHRLLGELMTAAGRHADARAHLDAALAQAEACAAPYERALTLLALAELYVASGNPATANTTLAEARAILAPLEARPALARADTIAARLSAPPLPFGLTVREAEVLRLLAEGLTDAQIAARLFVSRHTVNGHTKAIFGKLGVTSRAAATRLALDHDLR